MLCNVLLMRCVSMTCGAIPGHAILCYAELYLGMLVLSLCCAGANVNAGAMLVPLYTMLEAKAQIDHLTPAELVMINEAATFVSCSPTASKIVEKAWKTTADKEGLVVLPGVLSRKKQMIPALEAAANHEL